MDLKNGYKVIYEKIANGDRTFFADKMDGNEATQIGDAIKIGEYKLVFERDGHIYGSTTGRTDDGVHLEAFDKVFAEENTPDPTPANVEPEHTESTEPTTEPEPEPEPEPEATDPDEGEPEVDPENAE